MISTIWLKMIFIHFKIHTFIHNWFSYLSKIMYIYVLWRSIAVPQRMRATIIFWWPPSTEIVRLLGLLSEFVRDDSQCICNKNWWIKKNLVQIIIIIILFYFLVTRGLRKWHWCTLTLAHIDTNAQSAVFFIWTLF